MQRKWTALAVALALCLALAAGLSWADEDSELHKIMEQVNATNAIITKGVRTKVAYRKAEQDNKVSKSAEELVKLAEKAKPYQDAVKQAKDVPNAGAKWNQLMDELIKSSKSLAELVKNTPSPSEEEFKKIKASHAAVKKSCSDCHNVFRIEEEE